MSNLRKAPHLGFERMRIAEQGLIPGMESAVISVVPGRRHAPVCSGCGQTVRSIPSQSLRWVRHLRLAAHVVLLELTQRRLPCSTGQGTRTVRMDFLATHSRVTHRLAHYTMVVPDYEKGRVV